MKSPTPSDIEIVIEAMFYCLPADSHEQIIERINRRLGRRLPKWKIGQALLRLRKNPERYGWTVPHGQAGLRGQDSGYRFYRILVDKTSKESFFVADNIADLRTGVISTLRHGATSMKNEQEAFGYCQQYFKESDKDMRRLFKKISTRMELVQEDLEQLLSIIGAPLFDRG
jgi:hypothetical protein